MWWFAATVAPMIATLYNFPAVEQTKAAFPKAHGLFRPAYGL